jgi:hypothetical protein
MGRAAFLAPLICTVPESFLPPATTILSTKPPFSDETYGTSTR